MHHQSRTWRRVTAALALPMSLVLLAGMLDGGQPPAAGGGENPKLTLKIGSSQPETQPNFYCGMKLLKERVEAQNLNLTIDMFPNSQLGPDAERFASSRPATSTWTCRAARRCRPPSRRSACSTRHTHSTTSTTSSSGSTRTATEFFADFNGATDTTIIDAWYFGMRTFTATAPIRKPEDLASLKIRFPNTPQFLANAKALGANAVAIAVEELYLALQQGIAQGQENPVVATHAQKFDEVLKVASLTNHQVGAHYVVMSDKTLAKMSQAQKDALFKAVNDIRAENRKCVDDETKKVLDRVARGLHPHRGRDRPGRPGSLHHQGGGVLQDLLQGREPHALREHPGLCLTSTPRPGGAGVIAGPTPARRRR